MSVTSAVFYSCDGTLSAIPAASTPVYTTIWTTQYVQACPTSTFMQTFTITQTCTGDKATYTTPTIPPNFTTAVVVCDACAGQPTITVTRPDSSVPAATAAPADSGSGSAVPAPAPAPANNNAPAPAPTISAGTSNTATTGAPNVSAAPSSDTAVAGASPTAQSGSDSMPSQSSQPFDAASSSPNAAPSSSSSMTPEVVTGSAVTLKQSLVAVMGVAALVGLFA